MKKHLPLTAAALFFVAASALWAVEAATPARADWYGPGDGYGGPGYGHADRWSDDGPRHHHGMGPCGGREAVMIEHMDRFVSHGLDLNDTQEAAWKGVLDAAEAARVKVKDACGDRDDWQGTAPERLARMETMMQAGLAAVHDVRPKFDAFYATLTDRQKQRVDDMTVTGHHGYRR